MSSSLPDQTSLSNPLEVRVVKSHIALTVDFKKKILSGYIDHDVKVVTPGAKLTLDSDELTIKSVVKMGYALDPLQYRVGEKQGIYGQQIEITLPESVSRTVGEVCTVRIEYETSPSSSSLLWLEPKQTTGKVHPYVFSNSQCIHGRSVFPCQDTNFNKVTYTASLTVPKPLVALMGANATGSSSQGDHTTFTFSQEIPVCTYLIALAVGNLESRDINPKSRVWSEPEVVDKGVYEFANVEKFVKAAESILVPYPWGRYDILILPPSFAYGGMENPQLIFCSPTLLAGDRSLENVIAHEVAHSWMGNLVGCRTWNQFFLTEGFNVFLERKILGRVYGQDVADFEALNGLGRWAADVKALGEDNPLTCLRIRLDGFDPDDLFSTVPFERGFNFLFYLQSIVGVPQFEAWLKEYISKYSYQSVTVEILKEHFTTHFAKEPEIQKIDWEMWIDKPGMPVFSNKFSTKLVDAAVALAKRWVEQGLAGASPADLKDFSTGQKLTFLDNLQSLTVAKPFDASVLEAIDKNYGFTQSKNAELRTRWHVLCIRASYTPILPHVAEFLAETGRMRFIRPIYKELHKNPTTKQFAADQLRANQDSYHSIAAKQLAKDLEN